MRSPCAPLVAALVALALAACDAATLTPPPDPVKIGLQAGDLPASLQRCSASGDVDAYLRDVQGRNRDAHDELAAAWTDLQRRGATGAAVAVYAEQPAACGARLGTGAGPNVSSVVVRFKDEKAAASAFRRGMLGFSTPSEDEEIDDMTLGPATGLGRNAWVLERSVQGRSLIVALWERHEVTVLLMAADADPLHAKRALAAIDGRMP